MRSDLQKDTTYQDLFQKRAQKDTDYHRLASNLKKDGSYNQGTKCLGFSKANRETKSEINWKDNFFIINPQSGKNKMKKVKKCRHKIEVADRCEHCEIEDGICKKCDKTFTRDGWSEKWEEA